MSVIVTVDVARARAPAAVAALSAVSVRGMTRGDSHAPARVLVDATPLLGRRAGIGRYTAQLLTELVRRSDLDIRATAFSFGGSRHLKHQVPAGVRCRVSPIPARILLPAWEHLEHPTVEWLAGGADVFHATNFVLPPVRRAARVVTVHDLAFLTHPETMNPAALNLLELVPRALNSADAVCTVSEAVRHRVHVHFGVPLDRLFVTPNAVEPRWFAAQPPDAALRAALALPESYLTFVGTREPRKDLPTLVAGYRKLRHELGAAAPALVVIGASGWGEDPTSNAGQGIQVIDYLEDQHLPAVMAGARALVLPSLDEGFGMPAVEALAVGIPVVVSDIPVLREVTGGAALTFPVGDAAGLATALRNALEGAGAGREERVARALEFTPQQTADRTVVAYRFALDRRGIRTQLQAAG